MIMTKKHTQPHIEIDDRAEGNLRTYSLGFILSIIATLIPYFALQYHLTAGRIFVFIAIAAAVVQLFVQLVLFLHLSFKRRSLANTIMFIYAVVLIVTIVAGSLWIMANLNANMTNNVFPSGNYSPQSAQY